MNVVEAHKILPLLPLSVLPTTNHRVIMMHKPTPFDPSFFNHLTTRRPDAATPSALIWHARMACACKEIMQRTQRNSTGMTVKKDSWDQLDSLLPCSSCIAGKSYLAVPVSPVRRTFSPVSSPSRTNFCLSPATSSRTHLGLALSWASLPSFAPMDTLSSPRPPAGSSTLPPLPCLFL